MKTKKTNYLSKVLLFILLVVVFTNCSSESIEKELNENNVEEYAKFVEPGTGVNGGGTGSAGTDNEGDKDGDGDPDTTDPDPIDPCIFTDGSIGNPENLVWANADCDADGIKNIHDPLPYN